MCNSSVKAGKLESMDELIEASRRRFRTLAPVELSPESVLAIGTRPDNLSDLIGAADAADSIFWKQLFPNGDGVSQLDQAGNDEELRELILFNYGPYDSLDNEFPVLPVRAKLPGMGFYPEDLTREEFIKYFKIHPEWEPAFESPYTVIRGVNSNLTAIPYHIAYRDQVKDLSNILTKASGTEQHPLFRKFLAQRAADLLTDDYFQSDSTWVRLTDNPLDLVIGPYEVYEDQLMGLKSSYEARVLWRDFAESEKIQHFQQELPSLCQALGPELNKALVIGDSRLELSVADILYAGGFARKGIPAIALTLPNDEKVIEEVGSRQIILKNVLEAKFHKVAWPIINTVLPTPLEDEEAACRNFFNHTLFHEIAHSIGPHSIEVGGQSTTVNRALHQYYSVLEEAKADALGACFVLSINSDLDQRSFLRLFVAGFLRSIRYGLSHAHGGANIIQFNYLLQEGGFEVDSAAGELFINETRARNAILKLASEIIGILERGDVEGASRFASTFCAMNPVIEGLLHKLRDLPIDIRIRYQPGQR
jgi:hypothetical protein